MSISGIYQIVNVVDGNIYVGSSKNVEGRVKQHSYLLEKNCHDNIHLQRAYNKYGEDSFEWDILIMCDVEMLMVHEQEFIDTLHPSYNICTIVDRPSDICLQKVSESNRMRVWSEYSRNKLSASNKGRIPSAKNRKALSAANIGNKYFKGHEHTEEWKKKMSIALKDRKFSAEWRKKLSMSHIGHKHSDEHKRKISESLIGNQRAKRVTE